MLLYSITSTVLYFQQAGIVSHSIPARGAQIAFFAKVDLMVDVLTLVSQLFLTGRVLLACGVAVTLALLPALTIIGFGALALFPTIGAVVAFQVLRRAGNFAITRPTREVLFTVVSREDRFKAKSFIDTFVYRLGDQVGAWSSALLTRARRRDQCGGDSRDPAFLSMAWQQLMAGSATGEGGGGGRDRAGKLTPEALARRPQ